MHSQLPEMTIELGNFRHSNPVVLTLKTR